MKYLYYPQPGKFSES